MNTKTIAVYCREYSLFSVFAGSVVREALLKNYEYNVEFDQNLGHSVIDLKIDGRNVRIIASGGVMKQCDICIVSWSTHTTDYIRRVKQQVSKCKRDHPEAPIIVFGDATVKKSPPQLKDLELAGQKILSKKMGNELARESGAVKYVEGSRKSGRGLKIVIDEIVFAYFCKLKDEEDRERVKRTKRNLCLCWK